MPFGALPVELALSITRGIAEGLGAAHAKGMVHRDIKPENILMAREGGAWLPKIADFGIVATKESSDVFTRTGGTLLTMTYAAPEQWRGTPAAELDGRTDLYALGGLLYEMLTGQTAFHAESYEGWARQHQTTPPQPPSSLRPELANWQGLDALVQRLLAKDREDRPKDVAEMLSLLDAVRYLPTDLQRETVVDDAGKRASEKHSRRVPVWVWIASIAVLLIASFTAEKIFGPQLSKHPRNTSSESGQTVQSQHIQPSQVQDAQVRAQDEGLEARSTLLHTYWAALEAKARANEVWTDPATGLMWTKTDNGSEVNSNEARNYCLNLKLTGHNDWRLPTINELEGIYDLKANVHGYNVKGNLQLSGWEWSNSQEYPAWSFGVGDSERTTGLPAGGPHLRALCVRPVGK